MLYYAGTTLLGIPDAEFWRMTPRKLHLMVEQHAKINNPDETKKPDDVPTGFIDQVIF